MVKTRHPTKRVAGVRCGGTAVENRGGSMHNQPRERIPQTTEGEEEAAGGREISQRMLEGALVEGVEKHQEGTKAHGVMQQSANVAFP
jgi:hypothetical protein